MAKLIELRNVYKIYSEGLESEVRALDGVSLEIERGEFVAIVGQSGSGKSTMMNVLGCLDIPTRGDYFLNGTDVRELTDKELSRIRNKEIGFIFQQYNLIQDLTVLENVELPLVYQGVSADDRREMALAALERAVSYTHLDVYKRQPWDGRGSAAPFSWTSRCRSALSWNIPARTGRSTAPS